jgi:IS4 transposase
MILGSMFERFVAESPLSVMSRATIEHALSASALDELFDRSAEQGYTRELLFSTVVDLMSLVVCGKAHHVRSAYHQLADRVPVSLKSVYEKLQKIETGVSAALVRHVAGRCQELISTLGGGCPPVLPGRPVRILDGNHLAATQKRLQVTRGHTAGPLPGQTLAILDPVGMLIIDLIPCEDGHAQERALLDQVLPKVVAGEVWVDDRNFCTIDFLCRIDHGRAFFVTRRHGNTTVEPDGAWTAEVATETGWVSERPVWLCVGGQPVMLVRCVRVRLKRPTEDGDGEIEILTNLPTEEADAARVADVYRSRWAIEGAFHELTVALRCEVNTLGYPKAALFGFSVAVVAYNVLAVLKAALRAVHGAEKVQKEVSSYYVALEWAMVYAGMMIAIPPAEWAVFGTMSTGELARFLREWAARINLRKIKKSPPRKPTDKKPERINDKGPHVSTARLLDEARMNRQAKRRERRQG